MIDELPDGWALTTIEETCDLNPKHPNTIKDSTPVSFVPMAAVSEVDGRITGTETRNYGAVKKGFTHFADGDVIFAKITPCMENGKAASVRSLVNGLACGTTEFFVFRSRGAINQDYLFHFIRQESYRRAARATMQSGVGQARVPKEFVLNTELPLPPLAEQRRIVAKIEELTARSRAARAALAEVPTLLEQFRQSVLASAFRGDLTADWRAKHPNTEPASELLARIRTERRKQWETKYPKKKYVEPDPVDDSDLPELPEGWCWASLHEISEIKSGLAKGKHYGPNVSTRQIPYLRVANVQRGHLNLSEIKELPATEEEIRQLILHVGDILLNEGGDRDKLGRGWIWEGQITECIHQNHVFRARVPLRFFVPRFVSHYANSIAQAYFLNTGKQTTNLASINRSQVEKIPVPITSLEEQQEITALIEATFRWTQKVEAEVWDSVQALDQLDQSILAKAFRGELVPQDPADESASVLLERLRAEQAAAPEVRTRRRKVRE